MAADRAAANAGLEDGSWMPAHAFAAQASACNTHDTVDRLGDIRVPTLLTIGTADIFTPPAYTDFLHRNIPGSEVVTFPGWGHVHHWEDLERFNQVTGDWLKAH